MKILMITCVLAVCAALDLSAMPTEEETAKAEPVVRKLLENEHAALKAGKKTRAEVATAAMKLAVEADSDAAKLLLMKGAFVLYVKDGNLEKAVETMNTLEKTIAGMPAQSVTNMIELALMGTSGKSDRTRLYQLLDGTKKVAPPRLERPRRASKIENPPPTPEGIQQQETVGGYTWSYRVHNGEATIVAEKNGKPFCAISPFPKGDIVIPATLGGVPVTGIENWALSGHFIGDDSLKSVVMPRGLKNIGRDAFSYCSALKTVTLPNSVTNIGTCAFGGCMVLESLTIPASVKGIGTIAFATCRELKSVTFLGERPNASGKIFRDSKNLTAIHVPANAKSWTGMKEWQGIPLVFDEVKAGSSIASRIEAKHKQELQAFEVTSKDGRGKARFDYSCNGGKFTVIGKGKRFDTSWSSCSADQVYCYRDDAKLVGCKEGMTSFPDIKDLPNLDWSKRALTVCAGDVFVLMNKNGDRLAGKILDVKNKERGADSTYVEFEYYVYDVK